MNLAVQHHPTEFSAPPPHTESRGSQKGARVHISRPDFDCRAAQELLHNLAHERTASLDVGTLSINVGTDVVCDVRPSERGVERVIAAEFEFHIGKGCQRQKMAQWTKQRAG